MCYSYRMRLVCEQPNYFPWLGYFEKIRTADLFVYLDSVQWIRQGRQHRTRLPHASAPASAHNWLTVPVHGHGHREKSIREMRVDRSRAWTQRHWQQLASLYSASPHFSSQLEPVVRPALEKMAQQELLVDVCRESVGAICAWLGIEAPSVCSSELPATGEKSERLLSICQYYGAEEYYSGLGATRYLDLPLFRAADVRVRWQHFRATYPSDFARPIDYSVLDWLANVPREEILARINPVALTLPEETYAAQAQGVSNHRDGAEAHRGGRHHGTQQ